MYAIHQTEGIVLGVFEQGEVDSFYYVYTREYGLLGLLATGVRMHKSKFRYTLQSFTHVEVGFVKGKASLRITHASFLSRVSSITHSRVLAKLCERLRRLVKGEEQNYELYEVLLSAYSYLRATEQLEEKELYSLELLYTIRLLDTLGYWASQLDDIPFLRAPLTVELCIEGYGKRRSFLPRIEHALAESQL
jgi:DNA repair protein RecO